MKKKLQQAISMMLSAAMLCSMVVTTTPAASAAETESEATSTSLVGDIRIAVSADGNAHDEDDWAATAATLGIIAAVGGWDNLVHYDISSHVQWTQVDYDRGSFGFDAVDSTGLDETNYDNQMKYTLKGATELFGYDDDFDLDTDLNAAGGVFWDGSDDLEGTVAHLADEIEKSTEDNRLYMILGGPAQVFYMALDEATTGHDYVTIISHSNWNNNHDVTSTNCSVNGDEQVQNEVQSHNFTISIGDSKVTQTSDDPDSYSFRELEAEFPEVEIIQINDQNYGAESYDGFRTWTNNGSGNADYTKWEWMRDSQNEGLQFVYQRLLDQSKSDISDSGMTYFLLRSIMDGIALDQDSDTYDADDVSSSQYFSSYDKIYYDYTLDDYTDLEEWLTDLNFIDWNAEDASTATKYTVTYDSNGGSAVTSSTVIEGSTAKVPTAPVLENYVFEYWYADDAETAYDFDTALYEDLTLTAKWRAVVTSEVTVTVSSDGVALNGATVALTSGSTVVSTGTTDETGAVTFSDIPEGTYSVTASMEDYIAAKATVTTDESGASQTAAIELVEGGELVQGFLLSRYDDHTTTTTITTPPTWQSTFTTTPTFSWSTTSPLDGVIGADDSAAVISAQLFIEEAGEYGFTLKARDGSVLTVDGEELYLREGTGAAVMDLEWVNLTAGAHTITFLCYDVTQNFFMHLRMLMPGEEVPSDLETVDLIPSNMLYLPAEMANQVFVSGSVTDASGAAVAGATVTLAGDNTATAYTGENGTYQILANKGDYTAISVAKGGVTLASTDSAVTLAVDSTLTVTDNAIALNGTMLEGEPTADPEPTTEAGLQAHYYTDTTLDVDGDYSTLVPVTSAIVDNQMYYSWGSTSPYPDLMTDDYYSVIFTGYITIPTSGEYTFKTTSNDGGLLQIDGETITLKTGGGGNVTATVELEAGVLPFYLVTHEVTSTASIKVEWMQPGETDLSIIAASYFTCDSLELAGDLDIVSVDTSTTIEVGSGVAVADLGLPTTVNVTVNGGASTSLAVTWTSEDYNPDAAGSYTFTGELTLISGVTNGNNLTATATVNVVASQPIASITTLNATTAVYGTAFDALPLYQSIQVSLEDGTIAYIPVAEWSCEDYDANTAGTYTFYATLDTANAFIIEDTMASTECPVDATELKAELSVIILEDGEKPLVWIITDMSDNTLIDTDGDTVNDADDVSAMAGYLLMSNEFDTRGIVITSTHRSAHATSPNQTEWFEEYFYAMYQDEVAALNQEIGGFQTEFDVYQSCIKETSEKFNESNSYADLTNYDTVQYLVDEVKTLGEGEILNVLCWGSLTEQAIFVKHCIETNQEDLLEHVRFIAHWTNSSLNQGTPESPWLVANFNEDGNAGWYVKDLAFTGLFDYFELGAIGQSGIVNGCPNQGGDSAAESDWWSQFYVSQLGTAYVDGKWAYGKVDDSDGATYWALLGTYGVDLGDVDPHGNNAATVEQTNLDAFKASSPDLHTELLRRATLAAVEVEDTLAPAATISIEVASADTETGISVFNVVLESAKNLGAVFFTIDAADATVVGVNDFTSTVFDAEAGVYGLMYLEGNPDVADLTTSEQRVIATITVEHAEGTVVTISDVWAANTEPTIGTQVGSTTENTASTEEIFDLAAAQEAKITEITAALAEYAEGDYYESQWTELVTIFTDAVAEAEATTSLEAVAAIDVDAIKALADEILTSAEVDQAIYEKHDLNNDGVVNYSDITCIAPYYGHTVTPDIAKYDVDGDGYILSPDYLAVYNQIGA